MNTEQIVLSIICTVTWFAWIPAVLIEKEKNEDPGGTSILPVIPVFPLVGIAFGVGIDRFFENWGSYTISFLHLVLLGAFAYTIVRDLIIIKKRKKGMG
jgi:hypothetical protein